MDKEKLEELSKHLAKASNLLYDLEWDYERKQIDKILETVEETKKEVKIWL